MILATLFFSSIDPVSSVILLQLAIGGCIGGFSLLYRKLGDKKRKMSLKSDIYEEANATTSIPEFGSIDQ
jgi:hypothetical protein